MTTRVIRAAFKVLKGEGFSVDDYRLSKHLVMKASHPCGLAKVFTTSASPSDSRTLLNFRSEIRRALKEHTDVK